jgi:hypothetical protein
MATPLTRSQLDGKTCEIPGCEHRDHAGLILSPACHPAAPLDVHYLAGILTMRCSRCAVLVTQIKVAAC